MKINDFDIEYIHPKIWVFKKALKGGPEMIKFFEKTIPDQWKDWYTFGSHAQISKCGYNFNKFPSYENWNEEILEYEENEYVKQIQELFYHATKLYCNNLNIELPNWVFDTFDIAMYNEKAGVTEKRAMSYHTDYEQGKHIEPGKKFAITCLFYLNDDYEGGEIYFRIFNDDYSELLETISYKPSEGDIVIFPSGDPRYTKLNTFFHGVNIVDSGKKYLVRSYWKYIHDGDPEYFEEKKKYSENDWENYLKENRKRYWKRTSEKTNKDWI